MAGKLIVAGAAGKMGKRILSLCLEGSIFEVIGAIEASGHSDVGKDAGSLCGHEAIGIAVASHFPDGADVVIDFSQPVGADNTIDYCLENKFELV